MSCKATENSISGMDVLLCAEFMADIPLTF